MAGLNISIAFLFLTIGICEAGRRLFKRLFSLRVYSCLARELAGSLQLCAGCLELKMLMEIGLWGGGFGPDVTLTLLFLLFLAHGASFDGASANLTVSLQEFLIRDSSLGETTAKLLAQSIGMSLGWVITKYYWSWELTDFHLIQNLMSLECSSSLHTSLSHGVFVEGVCSFFFHLVILKFHHSRPMYRVPVLAVTVTLLDYIAGPFTGAFFNPVLATAVTFRCSGSSLQEYIQVYWLGPLAGMLAAVLLYQGNIPRLFQRNLLYTQKSKYRIPKARASHGSGDSKEQGRKKKGEKNNVEMKA
ncbi:AQP12 protein, partial [Nothoprocta pentlandii]|nr:AQP12 protein [Nothoprocta pentlandii]